MTKYFFDALHFYLAAFFLFEQQSNVHLENFWK